MRGFLRNRLLWIVAFLLMTLGVVYTAFGYLYASFRGQLDEELGARLVAVASATAAAVDGPVWERLRAGDPSAARDIREELEEIREGNALSTIFLFDPAEITVLDVRDQYPEGEPNPALRYDLIAATSALAGIPAYTRLYEGEGTFLKSGYAPVLAADGEVIGGVGVEASAAFFAVLDGVRGTLLGAAAAALVAVIVLGVGFARIEQLQAGLQDRLRRAESLAVMGQMSAMLAHEIRNPLGIIRGAAETLAERHGLKDEEMYRYIPEEVDRLHRTVSAYLDFARGGDTEGSSDAIDALRRSAELVASEFDRRGIVVALAAEVPPAPVRAGADRLRQAFLNVLLNARDALPRGGTVRIGVERSGERVVLSFADDGVGMTEEVRRRALEPFFTAKERGSGLGLAVVQRVVEDAGGRVDVQSRPGAGTTVTLTFPLAVEEERG